MTVGDAKALSWALSGLTVASDWVGSNEEWFPFQPDQRNIEAALEDSRCRAEDAVKATPGQLHPPLAQIHDRPQNRGNSTFTNGGESSSSHPTSTAPPTDHSQIVHDRNPTPKSDRLLVRMERKLLTDGGAGVSSGIASASDLPGRAGVRGRDRKGTHRGVAARDEAALAETGEAQPAGEEPG